MVNLLYFLPYSAATLASGQIRPEGQDINGCCLFRGSEKSRLRKNLNGPTSLEGKNDSIPHHPFCDKGNKEGIKERLKIN